MQTPDDRMDDALPSDNLSREQVEALMPPDLLNDVAMVLAGEDGCCGLVEADDGYRCCMTPRATAVFDLIQDRTGVSLEALTALARTKNEETAHAPTR